MRGDSTLSARNSREAELFHKAPSNVIQSRKEYGVLSVSHEEQIFLIFILAFLWAGLVLAAIIFTNGNILVQNSLTDAYEIIFVGVAGSFLLSLNKRVVVNRTHLCICNIICVLLVQPLILLFGIVFLFSIFSSIWIKGLVLLLIAYPISWFTKNLVELDILALKLYRKELTEFERVIRKAIIKGSFTFLFLLFLLTINSIIQH